MANEEFTSKSSSMAIISALDNARAEIARHIISRKTVINSGVDVVLPNLSARERQYSLEAGHISTAGTIVGYNSKYGVVVVLEPSYKLGKVEWHCKVLPVAVAPRECQ